MKTHTETKNKEPFDWNVFLNQENITGGKWFEAKVLASSWVTCACGNQCDIIPRRISGAPRDPKLERLGVYFSHYIKIKDKTAAKQILIEIEQRSTELIKELVK